MTSLEAVGCISTTISAGYFCHLAIRPRSQTTWILVDGETEPLLRPSSVAETHNPRNTESSLNKQLYGAKKHSFSKVADGLLISVSVDTSNQCSDEAMVFDTAIISTWVRPPAAAVDQASDMAA